MGSEDVTRLLQLAGERRPRCGAVRVIAVDGGAAAGKSTFADELRRVAQHAGQPVAVLATDDLLDGWAGQFGYAARLVDQVLTPLSQGRPARYERFNWHLDRFDEWVLMPPPHLLIVEGVGSILASARFTVASAYIDVGRVERERRWAQRDGAFQPEWRTWLDAEEGYRAGLDPASVDLIIHAGGRSEFG